MAHASTKRATQLTHVFATTTEVTKVPEESKDSEPNDVFGALGDDPILVMVRSLMSDHVDR